MKYLKYILPIALISLVLVSICIYTSIQNIKKTGLEEITNEVKPPFILFVPGFKSKEVSADEYSVLLQEVFPESKIEIVKWESGESTFDWQVAIDNAELFAESLFERIEKMKPSQRDNLVLIGHSLGGRIVIRVLAKLANQNYKIRRGIFLAAAIPDDDCDISKALTATSFPCINIHSRNDYVLRNVYGTVGENNTVPYMKCALGAYGSRLHYPDLILLDFKADFSKKNEKYNNHYATRYIYELGKYVSDSSMKSTLFPPMFPRRWSIQKDLWEKVDAIEEWILYRHILTMQYKIVSPSGNVSVLADEKIVMMAYENLKDNLFQVKKLNSQKITVEDEDVPLIKVIPLSGVDPWTTEEEDNGWLLQCNTFGTYRIVDAHDFQRAHGTKEQMRRVFENIKSQF